MMSNRTIRTGILLLVSVIIAFLLEALQLWSQPPVFEDKMKVIQEAESLNLSLAELINAELDEGFLKTEGEGSVALFRFQEPMYLSFLTIQSKKHIRNPITIRISLSRNGTFFAEEDSVMIEADPELIRWTVDFQDDQYLALKIETDGKLTIRSLDYQDAVEEYVTVKEGIRFWRVGILTVLLFCVLSVLIYYHVSSRVASNFRQVAERLKSNWRHMILSFFLLMLVGGLSYSLLRWLVSGSFFGTVNLPRQLFCISGGAAAGILILSPNALGAKPEKLFILFCLLTGSLMVFLFPNQPFVNWDAEYHYEQALRYSYIGDIRTTGPDRAFIHTEPEPEDPYIWEEREMMHARQQAAYDRGAVATDKPQVMLNSIYEIFSGTGLFLGRILHLSWNGQLYLGKLFNLLIYAVFGYFAIRRLKSGKMILACILLIPTNTFLASSFSYDPGVTVFLALALSYYFAEWQEPGTRLTRARAYIILGCGAFACLTKAFYFPVLLFTILLPRSKWAAAREKSRLYITRKRYILLVFCAVLISMIPYILPLLEGNMTTDMRGGTSTAPMEQLHVILEDPMHWLGVMLRYQKVYFSPSKSSELLTFFAYQGRAPFWQILYTLLIILAFTDKKTCDHVLEKKAGIRIAGLLLSYLVTCIICLCLYLTFTTIGADTINGVQPRYLLPIVFPVLMLAGSGFAANLLKINTEWKQRIYNGLAFCISLFVLYNGIWYTCVSNF